MPSSLSEVISMFVLQSLQAVDRLRVTSVGATTCFKTQLALVTDDVNHDSAAWGLALIALRVVRIDRLHGTAAVMA